MLARLRHSLAIRFAILLASAALVAGGLALQRTLASAEAAALAEIDRGLARDLAAMAALYEQRLIPGVFGQIEARLPMIDGSKEAWLLLDKQGGKLIGTLERWPDGVVVDAPPVSLRPEGGASEAMRFAAQSFEGGFRLLVGRDLSPVERQLAPVRRAGWLGLAGLVLALAIAAGITAYSMLRRVEALNRTLDEAGAGRLTARAPEGSDELGHVGMGVTACWRGLKLWSQAFPACRIALRMNCVPPC